MLLRILKGPQEGKGHTPQFSDAFTSLKLKLDFLRRKRTSYLTTVHLPCPASQLNGP